MNDPFNYAIALIYGLGILTLE